MKNNFLNGLKKYISDEYLDKLKNIKIGIAGAGGIGSNVANNLVRSGVINFKIVDYDLVEDSNLNRQFYFSDQVGLVKVNALKDNLLRINKDLKIENICLKVTNENIRDLFADCQYVVEAFDEPLYKTMLINSFIHSDKHIFSANGMAGFGDCEDITLRYLGKNIAIIGDFYRDIKNDPPLSSRVALVAARISDLIFENIILNNL